MNKYAGRTRVTEGSRVERIARQQAYFCHTYQRFISVVGWGRWSIIISVGEIDYDTLDIKAVRALKGGGLQRLSMVRGTRLESLQADIDKLYCACDWQALEKDGLVNVLCLPAPKFTDAEVKVLQTDLYYVKMMRDARFGKRRASKLLRQSSIKMLLPVERVVQVSEELGVCADDPLLSGGHPIMLD